MPRSTFEEFRRPLPVISSENNFVYSEPTTFLGDHQAKMDEHSMDLLLTGGHQGKSVDDDYGREIIID